MEEQQKCKCPAGIPAWVLTFADLMSLLMCFFVLLLSFAEMDVLKFKQIAGSLKVAFGVQRDIRAVEIPKGVNIVAKEFSPAPPQPTVINEVRQKTIDDSQQELKLIEKLEQLQQEENELKDKMENLSEAEAESEGLKKQLEQVQVEKAEVEKELQDVKDKLQQFQDLEIKEKAAELTAALKSEIESDMIEVEANEESITIRIREQGSFASGTANLNEDFIEILEIIAEELAKTSGNIIVAGHTDDIPINTVRFRSNWALSSARSVAVTHELLRDEQLEKSRFSIQAFADSKPLVDNDSPENRAINRRVEIIISQTKDDLGLTSESAGDQEQSEQTDSATEGQQSSGPDENTGNILEPINTEPTRIEPDPGAEPDDAPPSFIQF